MAAALSAPSARTIRHGVAWEEFERLVERNANGNLRYAYADGILEVTVPSLPNEECAVFFDTVVSFVALERDVEIRPIRSTMIKRAGLRKGVEPDAAYYVANERAVRGLREIDFAVDPPPDLVIEVDVTNDSMEQLPLFAALRFSEVWRYHDEVFHVLRLRDGGYEPGPSLAFPGVDAAVLERLFAIAVRSTRSELIRAIREYART